MIYQQIYQLVVDNKGFDIVGYDVRKHLGEMSYVMVVTANSKMHAQGICQDIKLRLKENNIQPYLIEGDKESDWVLMDYGNTLLHIMTIQTREKYNLEELYTKYFESKKVVFQVEN